MSRWRLAGPDAARHRPRISVSTGLLGLAVLVIVAFGVREALLRPPHRVLPPPIIGSVEIVPIGDVPADRLASLPADYLAEYGLTVRIAAPIALDPVAFDRARGQFVAQDLLTTLAATRPASAGGPVVIGVTQADIYIRGVDWNWAYAMRSGARLAIISVARMPQTRYIQRWWLMRKMLTRQLGFLCFGLPPTDDRYDILYRDILGLGDLRRISSHL
jgi:hypothetical protein